MAKAVLVIDVPESCDSENWCCYNATWKENSREKTK